MPTFPNEISFIVSANDKGDNPKRPDYRGEVKIGELVYDMAAWKRTKQGTDKQFVSGKLTIRVPKVDPGAYQPPPEPAKATPIASSAPSEPDDVPF